MSPVLFLTIAAVVLFVIVTLVVGAMIAAAIVSLSKAYISRQQHDLLRHAYDKGGRDDLQAMTEAVKDLGRGSLQVTDNALNDLRWCRSGVGNVDQGRVRSGDNDNDLPSSGDMLRSLPAKTSPDERFRKK